MYHRRDDLVVCWWGLGVCKVGEVEFWLVWSFCFILHLLVEYSFDAMEYEHAFCVY